MGPMDGFLFFSCCYFGFLSPNSFTLSEYITLSTLRFQKSKITTLSKS